MITCSSNYLCASFFPCLFSVKNTLNDCVEVVDAGERRHEQQGRGAPPAPVRRGGGAGHRKRAEETLAASLGERGATHDVLLARARKGARLS